MAGNLALTPVRRLARLRGYRLARIRVRKCRRWCDRNWAYLFWGSAGLTLATGGALGILAFTGTTFLPTAPAWWRFQVPVLDKSVHGDVVTAAVSWFAGTIALFTFFLNRDQKERQHKDQLDQARRLEGERERREREFENQRERRERDLGELQRLETEFAALADDFAQDAPLARINAAIGLGELARRPDPRREEDGSVLDDPRDDGAQTWVATDGTVLDEPAPWPSVWRSKKTERNYPYFLRAAHRLAAALHQWHEPAPRAQALRVLAEMGEWAKDVDTDEPLLHALVNALAEANRTAWDALREWAGYCLASGLDTDRLRALLGIEGAGDPIEPDEWELRERWAAEAFLKDLTTGAKETPSAVAFSAVPDEQRKPVAEIQDRLRLVGEGFWATRDALATALRRLSRPPDLELPQAEDGEGAVVGPVAWDAWRSAKATTLTTRRSLHLRGVRLFRANCERTNVQGADCFGAHFEGAYCSDALFEGANCRMAHFEGADCSGAHFEAAHCSEAHFEGAHCSSARFAGANCRVAHFEAAHCSDAHFEGADCQGAHFEGAACRWAHFEGANCSEAHFEGADCTGTDFHKTWLAGAEFGESSGSWAQFGGGEWTTAEFRFGRLNRDTVVIEPTGEFDELLWNFLNEIDPPEEGAPPRIPPWETAAETDVGDEGRPGLSPEDAGPASPDEGPTTEADGDGPSLS